MMQRVLSLLTLLALTIPAYSQLNVSAVDSLESALPADVLEVIKGATSVETIYPVNGNEKFDGQIIKADEIIFDKGSTLTLSTNKPWVAIIANKWKFVDLDAYTRIQRDLSITVPKSATGSKGANGQSETGELNRRGIDGGNGLPGNTGEKGNTINVPHLYIIAGAITSPDGEPLPGYLRLSLIFPGIDGGVGGDGGRGGDGGNAGHGKVGASGVVGCNEGGGPGGTGGAPGRGGQGGPGGNSSNGANITLIGLDEAIEILKYAKISNVPGEPGEGGQPGKAGKPGYGGGGASRNGFCGPTSPGADGEIPKPRDLGEGTGGDRGEKGTVQAIKVKSLKPVF